MMTDLFLDPNKPHHTCQEKDCTSCDVCHELNCHFNLRQLIHFLLMAFAVFIPGGIAIFRYHWAFLLILAGMIISYFLFIEIRVMCSHCPHYAEPGTTILKCWANYGAPKIWKYRPGPMSRAEKIVFGAGMIVVFLCPLVFIILIGAWDYLVIYLLLAAAFFATLGMVLCNHFMNFACLLNMVSEKTRNKFFPRTL